VIIQAIVALSCVVGMGVVMEGVATQEQRVLLRLAGCSEIRAKASMSSGSRNQRAVSEVA
jgi:predicted signal transduction protein with EAL and GGDEF domain